MKDHLADVSEPSPYAAAHEAAEAALLRTANCTASSTLEDLLGHHPAVSALAVGAWLSLYLRERHRDVQAQRIRLVQSVMEASLVGPPPADQHGIGVIERVRMERPHDYLRIVVAALPKDMNMSLSTQQRPLEFLTDAELTAIIRDSEQFLAAPKDK